MLKAQNVNKVFVFLVVFLLIINCSSKRKLSVPENNKKSNYYLKKFKSKSLFTGIRVKVLDNLDTTNLLPATVIINNVYLDGNSFNLGQGSHNLQIQYPSKKSVKISNLIISQKDSVSIKVILDDVNIVD